MSSANEFFEILERALENPEQWHRLASQASQYIRWRWPRGPAGSAADRGVERVYAVVRGAGDRFTPFCVLYEKWLEQKGGGHATQ